MDRVHSEDAHTKGSMSEVRGSGKRDGISTGTKPGRASTAESAIEIVEWTRADASMTRVHAHRGSMPSSRARGGRH